MMRLIRSSEFISSFLRRSSARRCEAERPAGAPGGAGAAPAPPPSSIPGGKGRGVTSAPHNGAAPPQRVGASTLQRLKQAPPSCVRAGEQRVSQEYLSLYLLSDGAAPVLKMAAPASEVTLRRERRWRLRSEGAGMERVEAAAAAAGESRR